MQAAPHVDQLRRKHSELEDRIHEATLSPSADALEVTSLKREKLRLKDQIARFETATVRH